MRQPPTACIRCQQAVCICKPENVPTARPSRAPKTSEHDKLMGSRRWTDLSKTFRAYNTQCQNVVNGKRCEHPAEEVHHLSAEIALFFRIDNLVALCKECHFKFQGEPEGSTREYAPTRWLFGAVIEHAKHEVLKSGEVKILEGGVAKVGR